MKQSVQQEVSKVTNLQIREENVTTRRQGELISAEQTFVKERIERRKEKRRKIRGDERTAQLHDDEYLEE